MKTKLHKLNYAKWFPPGKEPYVEELEPEYSCFIETRVDNYKRHDDWDQEDYEDHK